jgi:DnaJ-class molecular chaperone
MSRTEAYSILGLRDDASEAQIHAAYRVMIKKHHPDHGGSHAAAARINQAKDLLVG